jgi:hypothetical protein
MITGEADSNLSEVIEKIMETKIAMYKEWYRSAKFYVIAGKYEAINLSERLNKVTITGKDGKDQQVDAPFFRVQVKPNSNYPNSDEADLAMALRFSQPQPDGSVLVPQSYVRQLLSKMHPELSPGTKFYQDSQAEQIGYKVLAEQKAKQAQDAQAQQMVHAKLAARGVAAITGDAEMPEPNPSVQINQPQGGQ